MLKMREVRFAVYANVRWGSMTLPADEARKLYVAIAEARGKYKPLTSVLGHNIGSVSVRDVKTDVLLYSWSIESL